MKNLLTSLALVLLFATGSAWAGSGESHSDDGGCHHYDKWQDT